MHAPLTVDDPRGWTPDALAEAIRNAALAALRRAIAELPEARRDAFLLRELAGLSYEEISRALDVSEPALEALLVRARRRLRGALQPVLKPVFGLSSLPGGEVASTRVDADPVDAEAAEPTGSEPGSVSSGEDAGTASSGRGDGAPAAGSSDATGGAGVIENGPGSPPNGTDGEGSDGQDKEGAGTNAAGSEPADATETDTDDPGNSDESGEAPD